MRTILDLAFYKSLINSDFSLLTSNSNKKTNYIGSDLQLNSYNRLKTLDILQLLKSCKQFIRILQFINLNKSAEINLILANKQYFYLLKNYLVDHPITSAANINIYYLTNDLKKEKNKIGFNIYIGDSKLENYKARVRASVHNEIFLLQSINSNIELSQQGTYKIYNDSADFTKIIFLVSLLNSVFKNKIK
jgi:hypothetical protein